MSLSPLNLPGYSGKLHIQSYFSYLQSLDSLGEGISYLLLLHNSPDGQPDSQTAGAATSYLVHDLGKSEGSTLNVWGYPGTVGSTRVIAMVKAQ